MNECIFDSWTGMVKNDDTIYHLGDVLWREPLHIVEKLKKLPGRKILIPGNHDNKLNLLAEVFEIAPPILEEKFLLNGERREIVLCHYPMQSWNGSYGGSWHFYGHVHGRIENSFQRLDVGVDSWNFQPVPLELAAASIIVRPDNAHPRE
jgi:calcineurin-like phosphoesterase family protein